MDTMSLSVVGLLFAWRKSAPWRGERIDAAVRDFSLYGEACQLRPGERLAAVRLKRDEIWPNRHRALDS
jgi:hypothetical protein